MEVIDLCWETDRLITLAEQALDPDRWEDCLAILDQAEWLLEAAAAEVNPNKKETYEKQTEDLMKLCDDLMQQETRRRVNWSEIAYRTKRLVGIPIIYAVDVALKSLLLSMLYALLAVGVFLMIKVLLL